MNHPERLADYLKHISEAIDDAIAFLADCPGVNALAQDKRSQYAVLRSLEILGEAVVRMQSVGLCGCPPGHPLAHHAWDAEHADACLCGYRPPSGV
jgi:hypothetical protein